jgi:hypothetical protein
MRLLKIFILLFVAFNTSLANDSTKFEVLPSGHLFQPIALDPLQPQLFGSIVTRWSDYTNKVNGQYVPFGIGGDISMFRWRGEKRIYEFELSAGVFAQFEWKTVGNNVWQRNLLSSDYFGALLFNIEHNKMNATRFRLYHISVHNGDDYIIRNKVYSYSPNPNNYEQFDITHSYQHKNFRLYAGGGMNIRYETIRKRLFFELGFEYRHRLTKSFDLFVGTDVKSIEQNNFALCFKNAVGLSLKNASKRNLMLLLEYYHGHLPYSQFEQKRYAWLGAGLVFNL